MKHLVRRERKGNGAWTAREFRTALVAVIGVLFLANLIWNLPMRKKRPIVGKSKILPQFLGPACDYSDPHVARLVTIDEMANEEGVEIVKALKEPADKFHRKQWEFIAIVRALRKANMLQPGKRGLVFAAGSEPLISYFASFGPEILATDLDFNQARRRGWVHTNQHANSLNALYRPDLISRKDFDERVSFMNADMNHLNESWFGTFDFLWTTCSMEHVGSLL